MKTFSTLIAAATVMAFAFAGAAMADHKGFSHGSTPDNSRGGNSVDVTIICTYDGSIAGGTLTIDSAVVDVTGDGGTFSGLVDVTVQAWKKADGAVNFNLHGQVFRADQPVPFAETDLFSPLSFGGEDDLTGVVIVEGVDGSLKGPAVTMSKSPTLPRKYEIDARDARVVTGGVFGPRPFSSPGGCLEHFPVKLNNLTGKCSRLR